nr:integrase, catalytic region, zinc finger, CCHC-type, peptidase aspartic, catalytic [Tanacetum cinerariifolium]
MKSSTMNVETSIIEEVFLEISESFQGESSLSSLNDDVQQSPDEVILPQINTQLIPINIIPNSDEASTSHNVFNERLEDVGKLKAKRNIVVFIRYSKESVAFRIYNKRTRKIHESVNVNFDEILEMASKQFILEPGLSNLNERGKSSNQSVSQVSETSKKDLEDLFQDFYNEYVEVSESFQGESSLSSLNDDVQQSPEEVIILQTNTQSIPINMIPNGDEASTSHNIF